jgi:hypothetical protein
LIEFNSPSHASADVDRVLKRGNTKCLVHHIPTATPKSWPSPQHWKPVHNGLQLLSRSSSSLLTGQFASENSLSARTGLHHSLEIHAKIINQIDLKHNFIN